MHANRRRRIAILIAAVLVVAFPTAAQENCAGEKIFSSKNCSGDAISSAEKELFELVNKYRAENSRPPIRISPSLSMLGNRRMLDLNQNLKSITHSWSNCRYDIAERKSWPCLIEAPRRLACGYHGQGYETLYRTTTGTVNVNAAIDAWKKSSLHSSIILNQGMFADMPWDEVGIAIDGQFAALWFGYSRGQARAPNQNPIGLGISYERAVSGLSQLLAIEQASAMVDGNIWRGFSPDRKIKLELFGTTKEIADAEVAITIKLEPGSLLESSQKVVLGTLLKNIFPEWPDIEYWVENSNRIISQDPRASRTKVVRKSLIEMRTDTNGLKLSVRPQAKITSVEIF